MLTSWRAGAGGPDADCGPHAGPVRAAAVDSARAATWDRRTIAPAASCSPPAGAPWRWPRSPVARSEVAGWSEGQSPLPGGRGSRDQLVDFVRLILEPRDQFQALLLAGELHLPVLGPVLGVGLVPGPDRLREPQEDDAGHIRPEQVARAELVLDQVAGRELRVGPGPLQHLADPFGDPPGDRPDEFE